MKRGFSIKNGSGLDCTCEYKLLHGFDVCKTIVIGLFIFLFLLFI